VWCFPELVQVEGLLHTLGRALISAVLPVARVTARSFVPLKIPNNDLELRIFCHLWCCQRIRVRPSIAQSCASTKIATVISPVTHTWLIFCSNGHFDQDCVAHQETSYAYMNEKVGCKGSGNVQLCAAQTDTSHQETSFNIFSLPSSSHFIYHRPNMIRSALPRAAYTGRLTFRFLNHSFPLLSLYDTTTISCHNF
jgi:hypothetical protein